MSDRFTSVARVDFREPVPPPGKPVTDTVRHLQSVDPTGARYCESIALAGEFIVAGGELYPIGVVSKITPAAEEE